MSYPQLYRIREALESIKDLVANNSGFTTIPDGDAKKLVVKQEYVDPVVVANIGKQNKWLSFKLVIMSQVEEGITKYLPGVSIEISSANGYASVLSVEEFLTVYTLVHDLDLASLQAQFSLAFLSCEDGQPQMNYQYAPQNGIYQQNPYGGQQRNPGVYQQPRQQNGNGQAYPRYNQQPAQRPAPAGRSINTGAPQANWVGGSNTQTYVSTPAQGATTASLPPRNDGQQLMTLDAVASTPAEEIQLNIDDDSAIDDIFKE